MRIFLYIILLLLLNSYCSISQHRLKGFLGVEGGEAFNYILEFTDSAGHIAGYSYTYQIENKEVKARIEGMLDRQSQTLSFREKELLYNHGFQSFATICLIKADLRFVKEDNNTVFKGAITTNDITNVSCSGGTVVMNDVAAVRDVFEKKDTRPDQEKGITIPDKQVSKPTRYLYDTVARQKKPVAVRDSTTRITDGKPSVLHWQSDNIVLQIWDGGKVDGDVISIYVDGSLFLNRYTLTKERKKLQIPLTASQLVITIKAENEGNEPPNTANMLLVDEDRQHEVLAYNKIGKAAKIQILKK